MNPEGRGARRGEQGTRRRRPPFHSKYSTANPPQIKSEYSLACLCLVGDEILRTNHPLMVTLVYTPPAHDSTDSIKGNETFVVSARTVAQNFLFWLHCCYVVATLVIGP
jgi:hypothetical protein